MDGGQKKYSSFFEKRRLFSSFHFKLHSIDDLTVYKLDNLSIASFRSFAVFDDDDD